MQVPGSYFFTLLTYCYSIINFPKIRNRWWKLSYIPICVIVWIIFVVLILWIGSFSWSFESWQELHQTWIKCFRNPGGVSFVFWIFMGEKGGFKLDPLGIGQNNRFC